MYIGIDLDVTYKTRQHMVGQLMKRSEDIRKFLKELEAIKPEDFVEARLVHKPTDVDIKIDSIEDLREQVYKYMFWVPEGLAK